MISFQKSTVKAITPFLGGIVRAIIYYIMLFKFNQPFLPFENGFLHAFFVFVAFGVADCEANFFAIRKNLRRQAWAHFGAQWAKTIFDEKRRLLPTLF